jgi:DNA-binding NtrC family response regulator
MKGNILILDDNKSVLTALEMLVQTEFDLVVPLSTPNVLLSTLQQQNIDVVLLDMNFKAGINTGNEGIFWLHQIQKHDPSIVVVMITAYGDVELAVKAVKEGAFDFILKPWDNYKLISTLNAAMKLRKSQSDNKVLAKTAQTLKQALRPPAQPLIGESEAMKKVMTVVKKVAATDANILIVGENGTGKELIACEIHQHSLRKNEVMMNVDMGAITETLFESELFGHTKGAFTDAKEERAGKFEAAHKGTLFLDEIGNLPLAFQAKLLVVLQSRNIVKLGSNKPIPVDIRLITATNMDLPKMISEGLFREDLLYRINTITIEVPPLRERGNDVVLLAEFYLEKYGSKYNKPGIKLSRKAATKLLRHSWPGNVRELQHSIEKAVILADSDHLTEESFVLQAPKPTAIHLHNKTIEEMEKEMIQAAIQKENGNMSAVAKKLGISRPTLYKKLKAFDE